MRILLFFSVLVLFTFSCKKKNNINTQSIIADSINQSFIESVYANEINILRQPHVKIPKKEYESYMNLSKHWTEYLDHLQQFIRSEENFSKDDLLVISKRGKNLDNHLKSINDLIIDYKIIEFRRHQKAVNEILTLLNKPDDEEESKILISKLRKQYLITGSRVLKFLNDEHQATWRFAPFLHFKPYKSTIPFNDKFHAVATPVTGLGPDYDIANPYLINISSNDTTYLSSKDGQIEINIRPSKTGLNKYHLYVPIRDWRFDTTTTVQEIEFFAK